MSNVKRPVMPKRKPQAETSATFVQKTLAAAGVSPQAHEISPQELQKSENLSPIAPEPELTKATRVGDDLLINDLTGFMGLMIPNSYNVRTDIDPLAEQYLENLYEGDVDAELLAFYQEPHELQTTEGPVTVAGRGVYMLNVSHPESDSYLVDFAHIKGLGYVYEGKWQTPNVTKDKYIELPQDREDREYVLEIIKNTFEWGR